MPLKQQLAAVVVTSALWLGGLAQAPARQQTKVDVGPQWVALFNGKDLTGWKKIGEEKWVVENGAIYGEGVTEKYGYLITEKDYKDFELAIRFKCEADGNSGVYIRTRFTPGTVDVSEGYQVEIDRVLNHHTGGVYGDNRGWMAWPAPEYEMVIRPYEWNDMYIKVVANRTIVRLNGVQVLDFTNPAPRSTDGAIALQLHSGGQGRMRFTDIYLRDLSLR
ncbi:MAG: DUF1080 domain-containing protein [Acidobacteria bacterium]|nr:MAG: DUF1080 domain-containing protein [Acidobacteriota bacterium]